MELSGKEFINVKYTWLFGSNELLPIHFRFLTLGEIANVWESYSVRIYFCILRTYFINR